MKKILKILLPIFYSVFIVACNVGKIDYMSELNLSTRFLDDSRKPGILRFHADSQDEAQAKCQPAMPKINKKVTGGGISPDCFQYKPKKYSCICVLTLFQKNRSPLKKQVFYLKE